MTLALALAILSLFAICMLLMLQDVDELIEEQLLDDLWDDGEPVPACRCQRHFVVPECVVHDPMGRVQP